MKTKKYIVSVDFGNSNMVMAVGSTNESGLINIETVVSEPSKGIENGLVDNINEVKDLLLTLRDKVEEQLGIRVEEAYAGLSGSFIRYENYVDHVFVRSESNGVVSKADVEALHERMRHVTVPEGEMIIDCFPQHYSVDGRAEDPNPVGTFGMQLSSKFAFIVSEQRPLDRLRRVFNESGIRLAGIFSNSAVMPRAILTPEEMREGTVAVDIGGSTTDVAVCRGGLLRYAASIPLGAGTIDNDINKHGVPEHLVEKLKIRCGSAVADMVSETAKIKLGKTSLAKIVMKRNLASIIEARLTDIAEYVKGEIRESGYEKRVPCGIVLTGGAAATPDIEELFRRLTGMNVRTATATEGITTASVEMLDSPEYTGAVALLIAGCERGACKVTEVEVREVNDGPQDDELSGREGNGNNNTKPEDSDSGVVTGPETQTNDDNRDNGDDVSGPDSPEKDDSADNDGKDKGKGKVKDKSDKTAKERWKKLTGLLGRGVDMLRDTIASSGEDEDPSFSDMESGDRDEYFVDGKDKDEI
ncbi:MAG: cell division protein FtsA [Alistipes sp.]|nr:cell division protein FtsA [Alistipes sp.]